MPASLLTVTPLTASGISSVIDDIPQAGLNLWLDAYKIAGINSNTSLSAWTDSSGSGSHATQGSAASQPKYFTNVQNGLPAVRFSGGQLLTSNTSIGVASTVFLASAISSNNVVVLGHANMGVFVPNSVIWQLYATSGFNDGSNTTGAWTVVAGMYNGASSILSVAGKSSATGDVGSITSAPTIGVGGRTGAAGLFMSGDIGEVLMYNRNLSTSEFSTVRNYLAAKWGVTL